MKHIGKLLIVMLLILVSVALVLRYRQVGQRLATAPQAELRRQDRPVALVRRGELRETREVLATIRALQSAELSPQLTGRILEVTVREGDRVETGEVLVRIDAREWRSQTEALERDLHAARERTQALAGRLAAARATEERMQRERERTEILSRKGISPTAVLDAARERHETARAARTAAEGELAAAEAAVTALQARRDAGAVREGFAIVTAPFSGIVAARLQEPGDLAAPGHPLLRLLDPSRLTLEFELVEDDLPRLKTGLRVLTERLPAPPVIRRIVPQLSPRRMVRLEADFSNPASNPLLPGQSLPIRLELRQWSDVLLIPRDALAETTDGPAVFRDTGTGLAVPLPVNVLASDGEQYAVEGALQAGERIIRGSWLQWLRLPLATSAEAAGKKARQ